MSHKFARSFICRESNQQQTKKQQQIELWCKTKKKNLPFSNEFTRKLTQGMCSIPFYVFYMCMLRFFFSSWNLELIKRKIEKERKTLEISNRKSYTFLFTRLLSGRMCLCVWKKKSKKVMNKTDEFQGGNAIIFLLAFPFFPLPMYMNVCVSFVRIGVLT